MIQNKKGQGLPLNTIIIAIIVIVVLVVIILIFTGQLGNFIGGTNACVSAGGYCTETASCVGDFARVYNVAEATSACTERGAEVCCRGVGS